MLTAFKDDRIANGSMAIVLLIGTVLTAVIKADYRRQKAAKELDDIAEKERLNKEQLEAKIQQYADQLSLQQEEEAA